MKILFYSLVSIFVFGWLPGFAGVVVSEYQSDPAQEGWQLVDQYCDPVVGVIDGWYQQELDMENCPGSKVGAQDVWRRTVQAFNGHPTWFLEYNVNPSGDSSEIPGGAPTVLAAANSFGIIYHMTVASNQVKFVRDVDQPILFFDVKPGTPHRVRLELVNKVPPTYAWYIGNDLVDQGVANGMFPVQDARVTWQGRSWHMPTLNQWDYIRFGDIPLDASGDFDSNGAVDSFDHFYFFECLDRSAAGEPASPSCAWADFNADNTVDCADWNTFRVAWTGPDAPPVPPTCAQAVPADSPYGLAAMSLLTFSAAMLVFRFHRPRR